MNGFRVKIKRDLMERKDLRKSLLIHKNRSWAMDLDNLSETKRFLLDIGVIIPTESSKVRFHWVLYLLTLLAAMGCGGKI